MNKTAESFVKHNFKKNTTMVYTNQDFRAKLKKPKRQKLNEQSLFSTHQTLGTEFSIDQTTHQRSNFTNVGVPYLPSQQKNNMFTTTSLHSIISHKHIMGRNDELQQEDDPAFLKDPSWPRNDYAPNLTNYADRRKSPEVSFFFVS